MADRTGPATEGTTARAPHGMIATVDPSATRAGLAVLAGGGNAVDAAVAANAVLAVTSQHLCGVGGDLFALVLAPGADRPVVLDASGRAGSGAEPDRLRAEGHTTIPARDDVRAVTVPGVVDGWTALLDRFGTRSLADLLAPAMALAVDGFPVSPTLVDSAPSVRGRAGAAHFTPDGGLAVGATLRRPRLAAALQRLAEGGRDAWYGDVIAPDLVALGEGLFTAADVMAPHADWVEPIVLDAWGQRLWTTPPGTQGYLTITAAHVAAQLDLPADPDDPAWAHLLIEAAKLAGHDRPRVLHEHADLTAHLDPDRLRALAAAVGPTALATAPPTRGGDTTYLCAVDRDGMAVSLIQSNAGGFGSGLVLPGGEVFLHNRGLGFSLQPGHPAELGPGRRPPHTLSPLLVTTPGGGLRAVLGTMGGDSQPQILLQLLARLFHVGQDPRTALGAGRWVLASDEVPAGFATWAAGEDGALPPIVEVEGQAPAAWTDGLAERGHRVRAIPALSSQAGHAQAIVVAEEGLAGAADPRTAIGLAAGN